MAEGPEGPLLEQMRAVRGGLAVAKADMVPTPRGTVTGRRPAGLASPKVTSATKDSYVAGLAPLAIYAADFNGIAGPTSPWPAVAAPPCC